MPLYHFVNQINRLLSVGERRTLPCLIICAVLSYLARPYHRLSGAGSGEEGEAAALKASAKEAGSLEDKQLAEALAR